MEVEDLLIDDDLHLDSLLAAFSGADAAVFDLFVPSPPPEAAAAADGLGSPESVNSVPSPGGELSELERFLMEDGDDNAVVSEGISVEEFFDAVFAGGDGSGEEEKDSEAGTTDGDSGREEEAKVVVDVDEEVDGDDPISKKKRRQIRNRDSAMKSRERKKMYVKDLETKSKYLEAECRRLSYALQCCAAENMALRQSLLKDNRPAGAPVAMQESAVLTETLPLVSLLWLVSIVCLFLVPSLPNQSPMAPSSLGRDLVMVAGKISKEEPETLELILQGRRCKGTRARIKFPRLPLHDAIAAC